MCCGPKLSGPYTTNARILRVRGTLACGRGINKWEKKRQKTEETVISELVMMTITMIMMMMMIVVVRKKNAVT